MKNHSPFTQTFEQLPRSLPIFPLANAVVLPGGVLPLNIFEPRYLNMFHDAMRGDQLIGMIQPKDENSPPNLFDTGCAARITRYEETMDGRLEVMLSGLCRFRIEEEVSSIRGYRLIVPDWSTYSQDFDSSLESDAETLTQFLVILKRYFQEKKIDVDWNAIEQLSQESLVNTLCGQLPIATEDKQILIECNTLSERVKLFTVILEKDGQTELTKH